MGPVGLRREKHHAAAGIHRALTATDAIRHRAGRAGVKPARKYQRAIIFPITFVGRLKRPVILSAAKDPYDRLHVQNGFFATLLMNAIGLGWHGRLAHGKPIGIYFTGETPVALQRDRLQAGSDNTAGA
jgi:hypothetical protein